MTTGRVPTLRGALGQRYEADRLAIEHLDAVERRAHAPAAPQIAVDVDPKAVGSRPSAARLPN